MFEATRTCTTYQNWTAEIESKIPVIKLTKVNVQNITIPRVAKTNYSML